MATTPFSPPRTVKQPPAKGSIPKYQTRWEKEKEKAKQDGVDIDKASTDPHAIGPWVLGETLGKGASGQSSNFHLRCLSISTRG